MKSKGFRRRALGVGLSLGLLPGCGTPTVETKISKGIVTSLSYTSESEYLVLPVCTPGIDMQGNPTLSCSVSSTYIGEADTITVSVLGCRREAGKKVIADDEYLEESHKHPSDYPVVGGPFIENIDGQNRVTTCSYDVELEDDFGKRFEVGDIAVMSELYKHDIETADA